MTPFHGLRCHKCYIKEVALCLNADCCRGNAISCSVNWDFFIEKSSSKLSCSTDLTSLT